MRGINKKANEKLPRIIITAAPGQCIILNKEPDTIKKVVISAIK
jgi:hypothetical protein